MARRPSSVTVFGFRPEQAVDVIHHFSQCGEILNHHVAGDNFMHIQFATRLSAQQALSKNGRVFFGAVMLGVVPFDGDESAALASTATVSVAVPRRAVGDELASVSLMREYAVEPHQTLRPQSTLGKFIDYVFGV
jgi:hypothetical protein